MKGSGRNWALSKPHRFRVGLEHMETTLLTEFHKWASPVGMRQRSHSAVLRALGTEVEAISERGTTLEQR